MSHAVPLAFRNLILPALGVLFVGVLSTARGGTEPAFTFKRGVNISHWLSQNEGSLTYAAPWFGEGDVEWIAKQGFDHIRLPVDFRALLRGRRLARGGPRAPSGTRSAGPGPAGWASCSTPISCPAPTSIPWAATTGCTHEGPANRGGQCWRLMARHFAGEGP